MADKGAVILHAFYASSCAWRVRLALEHKEIPYQYKAWDTKKGEQKSEAYKRISALGLVPALEIDGEVLNDSVAILEYLEERFPEKPLLPKDLKKKAAIRSVVQIIAANIQPLQNSRVLDTITQMTGDDGKLEWAQKWIVTGFDALELILGKTAGRYSFGDEFTMADVLLVPQIYNANLFKIDMGKFPTLERVHNNLYELKLISHSKPDQQPDYPRMLPK